MGFKIKKKAKSHFIRGKHPLVSRMVDRIKTHVMQGVYIPIKWGK